MFIVILWLGAAFFMGYVAKNHGRNYWPWFTLTLFIGPIFAYIILKLKSMSGD